MIKMKGIDIKKEIEFFDSRVTLRQKAMLARNLAVLLRSGLPISEALVAVAGQSTGRLKKILPAIRQSVDSGNSLSSSFSRYPDIFPGVFVSAVLAGELSGNLENNFDHLATKLRKDEALGTKIRGAMVYPAVIIFFSVILSLVMAFVVLPKIMPMFKNLGIRLPLFTRVLIDATDFLEKNTFAFFISLIAFVGIVIWSSLLEALRPFRDRLVIKAPLVGPMMCQLRLANIFRTLYLLLMSGLNIDEAIALAGETANNYHYKQALSEIRNQIMQGSRFADNMKKYPELFPPLSVSMVDIGEKSGRLSDTFLYLADIYDEEVDNSTKSLSVIIEPVLLVAVGLIVGGLAISIISPIYQITGQF